MSLLVHQRRLLFWQKMIVSDNIILATLSRSTTAQFIAVGSSYGISTWTVTPLEDKSDHLEFFH